MSINLVTYANQTVTPMNDAIIYERAIDQNGVFYGCNVTVSGNNVNITGGYGIVCGREFVVESESIAVTLAPSGTLDGRLYVRLDLADVDNPIQLLTATGNSLPPLEQDSDVNYTNGTYEMELATFDVGVSALSNVVETFVSIVGTNSLITNAFNTLQADYVIDKGTSGDWTFRKWNSGRYECWQRKSVTTTLTTARGVLYSPSAYTRFDYPFAMTGGTPTVIASVSMESTAYALFAQLDSVYNDHCNVRVLSGSSISSSVQYQYHVYVLGRWK